MVRQFAASRSGFSLLEILVAFTVLAVSLGVLMQVFSGSLRHAEVAEDQAKAVAIGQSLLAAAGVEQRLTAGESQGRVGDRHSWRLRVVPFDRELPGADANGTNPSNGAMELWEVAIEVFWGDGEPGAGRRLVLSSIKLQVPERLP
jgi:general secretion pathway protein I